ncbi:MAG: RNA polymerase sigma factor [Dorea sp.]|nr:RNA polymerase sigma factor [Dorea sp.]
MDFEEIYITYFRDIYLFILAMSKDAQIAEEITQETFFKALKNIDKFGHICSVKTWLCQIGKNTYLSYLEKQKHFAREDWKDVLENDRDGKDGRSPEALFLKKEEVLSLYKVLEVLREPYKEVFTLRIFGDLSFREIGEIFGRREGWARVTYHRAKLKIQETVRREEE